MNAIHQVQADLNSLQLRKSQVVEFSIRTTCYVSVLVLAVYGILATTGVAHFAFQLLAAFALAHGTELAHQALHRTGTGNATWDRRIGMMMAWPTGVSFLFYKWFHLWHHGQNGTNEDSESFGYAYGMMESKSWLVRMAGFVRHMLLVDHFVATAKRMWSALTGRLLPALQAGTPAVGAAPACEIQYEYRLMLALYVCAAFVSIVCRSTVLLHVWLIPVVLWAPIHALVELPEHWGTAPRPNEDAFQNTRTIRAGWVANYFTNANAYHVEHHFLAAIPLQRLSDLHGLLVSSGKSYRYLEESYPAFFAKYFRQLWLGPQAK